MILVTKPKESKVPSTMRLANEWTPKRSSTTGKILPDGLLWAFAERISLSRREGYVSTIFFSHHSSPLFPSSNPTHSSPWCKT